MKIQTSRLEVSYPLLLASIAFILFHFYSFLTDAEPLYNQCSNTGNYTAKSSYESNMNSLLDSFPSNVQLTGFYNAAFGTSPDRVYGLVFCRGDIDADDCRNCVNEAREDILRLCPYKKTAIVWYDYCALRYSDSNFFSTVAGSNWIYMYHTQNVTEPHAFKQALRNLLDRLVLIATNDPNSRMFATGETDFRSSRKLYGLVQCTRDVSREDCKQCLDLALSQLGACCDGKRGGRIMGTNCLFRYEEYSFYRASPSPPPLLQPPPAGASNRGDSGKIRKWLVPVVIIIILTVFLMSGTFIYLCQNRGNKHDTLLDEDGNYNNDADIPF